MDVLVVAAHPDDELLGVGGTVIKHVDAGDSVHVVIMSEGSSSRYGDHMKSELRCAARRASEVMGSASLTFGDLPDQRLDTLPIIEVTQQIQRLVQEIRPSVVYTHGATDANRDHTVVSEATWTAVRPYSAPWVKRVVFFETPSSTEWGMPLTGKALVPNFFSDISQQLTRKLQAMAEYESETRPYPHPRSLRALEERARHYGSLCGLEAAEPLVLARLVE